MTTTHPINQLSVIIFRIYSNSNSNSIHLLLDDCWADQFQAGLPKEDCLQLNWHETIAHAINDLIDGLKHSFRCSAAGWHTIKSSMHVPVFCRNSGRKFAGFRQVLHFLTQFVHFDFLHKFHSFCSFFIKQNLVVERFGNYVLLLRSKQRCGFPQPHVANSLHM